MSTDAARSLAQIDFSKGLGHEENPYSKVTPERTAYMLEMARLQNEEFKRDNLRGAA